MGKKLTIGERLEQMRGGGAKGGGNPSPPPVGGAPTIGDRLIRRIRAGRLKVGDLIVPPGFLDASSEEAEAADLLGVSPDYLPPHLHDDEDDPDDYKFNRRDDEIDAGFITVPSSVAPDNVDELERVAQVKQARREREVRERRAVPSVKKAVMGAVAKVFGGGTLFPVIYYVADTDEEAIPITVVTLPAQLTVLTKPVRPFVRVRWGTRATVAQTDVDIGPGNQFTVMGSSVLVAVGADSVGGGVGGPNNPVFQSGAMAGLGVWSGTSPVWRTHFYDNLVPNVPQTQTVPTMAASLYAVQRSQASAPIEIQFVDVAGSTLYDFTLAANTFFNFPIPIADDVAQIVVTNNGNQTVQARAMFALAL